MKKTLLFVTAGFLILLTNCTKVASDASATAQSGFHETLVRRTNSGSPFCTSSCSDYVGYISDGTGSGGMATWGNFHLWISNPLPYDVVVSIVTRVNGNLSFTQYGQDFVIPAGQNNTAVISAETDAAFLCSNYNDCNSASRSASYTVEIVSVYRADNFADLNSNYQLYPGTGSFTISNFCVGSHNCDPKDGGGGGLGGGL